MVLQASIRAESTFLRLLVELLPLLMLEPQLLLLLPSLGACIHTFIDDLRVAHARTRWLALVSRLGTLHLGLQLLMIYLALVLKLHELAIFAVTSGLILVNLHFWLNMRHVLRLLILLL